MPKCIKVINELVRMGEWIYMGDLSDRNVDPETTDWWSWHLMPARDLSGGMTGKNDYHIFDLHVQLRKEDSEDPESRVACKIYLFNDVPEDIIRDKRKRQMANSCTAYLDFHGPDYDGDNAYINQGPADDNGKKYHFTGGPERDIWRWVDNRGLSNILKLIMDAGTDRFRREMDSIAHCKPISVKLGYFGTNCWGNSNIYPLLCTFIEQWMSPSALSWSLGYDTNEYGRGNQLREWRRKVEAWQGSKRMNEDGECCGDAGGAAAVVPVPCAPVQTVMNTVGVGDPVPAGMPGTDEFGSGDRFDLQLGESPNKKSKKKPARKKGANEAFRAGNRARKKESVQDAAAVTDPGYPDFDTVKKTLSRILTAAGARESHEGWWSTEENVLKPDGIRSSNTWYFSFKADAVSYCSYSILARVYNADTDKHPCLIKLKMGISNADPDLLDIILGPKYDSSWMTPEDGRGYWSGSLMARSSAAEYDFPEKVKALADAVTSPDFKALIQAIGTVSVPEPYFHSVVRLIMSPVLYEFYTDEEKKHVDEFFLGRMVLTSMAIRNSESFSKETLDLLKKIAAMWEKRTGQQANLVSFTAADEAFRAGNRARKKESAAEAAQGVDDAEIKYKSAEAVRRAIMQCTPDGFRFRAGSMCKTAWTGFISKIIPNQFGQRIDTILVNVQERDSTVSIYATPYSCESMDDTVMKNRQDLMKRKWTDDKCMPFDGDRFPATAKTVRDLWNFIELHNDALFSSELPVDEAFRAGNRARKKETVQDTVEGVGIDWNKAVQNIFDETEETDLRSSSYMKDMLPERLAPVIEKMPGVASVSVKNSFWGGKELLIMTPDHPDHRKIDGRFDIFLQPVYTRNDDGDTNLGATLEAVLVFGYHDPDEITVNDFKYKWRSEIGRFSPLHTDRWGEALARLCDFAGNSGFDMLDRLMTLDKWVDAFRPFLGPDSITSTFRAMNMDLFKDNIISCMSGSSWYIMLKTIKQLEAEGK